MSLLNNTLELKKTHDYCGSKRPRLTAVFIHGIATDSSSFTNTIRYLEGTRSLKDVRFVAFDLLGSGKSRHSDKLSYDYGEQVEALRNSIQKLKINTPLLLIGHSMGSLIAVRYANTYKKTVNNLILVSPPVYSEKDLDSPAFAAGIKVFRDAVALKNRKIIEERAFNNSMEKIILNRKNYKNFIDLKTPAVIIYGNLDQFIAPHNIPKILKENPKYLTAIKTEGRHGVSRDKYTKMVGLIEEMLNAEVI